MQAIWRRQGKIRTVDVAVRASILIAMAGPEAEIATFGVRPEDAHAHAGDVSAINFFLTLLAKRERSRTEKRMRRFAKQLPSGSHRADRRCLGREVRTIRRRNRRVADPALSGHPATDC